LRTGRRIAIVGVNIAALRPSKRFQFLLEFFHGWIVEADERADQAPLYVGSVGSPLPRREP